MLKTQMATYPRHLGQQFPLPGSAFSHNAASGRCFPSYERAWVWKRRGAVAVGAVGDALLPCLSVLTR